MNQLKQLINKHEIIEIQKFVRNNCVEIEDVRELLIYALQNKENNRIIEYLIELLNYNLNYYNQEGKVPLFVSLQQKNYYITDKLLKNKADINYIDKNGENVLLYLYHKKVLNEKMLVYLLEKGIDVSYCQQKTDKTFLDYIDEYRNRNFINIILKYFYNNDVEVVLSLILSHKNKWGISNRLLKEIIRYRINPKIKNKLMLLAYHHNNINLLRFLFKSSEDNIDFIKNYEQQERFIDYKIYTNELEILLIENGTDIDIIVSNCYDNQYTELLRICKFTNILERVKFLISYGARVNQKSYYRNEFSDPGTPIIFSIRRESLDIIKYLYENGADLFKVKDHAKNYALKAALENILYLKYLTENTSFLNRHYLLLTMMDACADNHIECVKYFMEHGIDINERVHCVYGHDVTPLYVACQHHHIDLVKYLIDHGANTDFDKERIREKRREQDKSEQEIGTILNYTFKSNNKELAHYLMKHNAGIYDSHTHKVVKNDISLVYQYGGPMMASYFIKNKRLRNERDASGNTILMKILMTFPKEHADRSINYLISKRGMDINIQNNNGDTLLMIACQKNYRSLVEKLIEHHVELDTINRQGNTALIISCQNQCYEIVKLLLQYQANISIVNNKGHSVLHIACMNNNEEIAKLLMEQGANEELKDYQGWTPLTYAYRHGNLELIQYIQERMKEKRRKRRRTEMENEIEIEIECQQSWKRRIIPNYQHLNQYLHLDIDINCKNKYGLTALMMACDRSNVDFVKFLISHGADINAATKDHHQTALTIAYKKLENRIVIILKYLLHNGGNVADIKNILCVSNIYWSEAYLYYFIQHQIDINGLAKDGETALIYACKQRNLKLMKYLLRHGAYINGQNKEGKTVFMQASIKVNKVILNFLLDHHANPDLQDIHGTTALMYACKHENINMTNYLLNHQAKLNLKDKFGKNELMISCLRGNLPLVKILLRHGANLQDRDNQGHSVLMYACKSGNLTLVRYLMAQGLHFQSENKKKEKKKINSYFMSSVLARACIFNYREMVQFLIEQGMDINTRCHYQFLKGETPLMIASDYGHFELVTYLLEAGAEINAELQTEATSMVHGKTAYMFAYQSRHYDIAIYLLQHGAKLKEEVERVIDVRQRTFLSLLCQDQVYLSYIQFLIEEKGASITSRDCDGNTPFLLSCAYGNQEMIKYLHGRGAKMNEKNDQKETGLQFACSYGKNRIVEYLIDHGADMNSINKQGCTPIMMACYALRHRPMDWNERDGVLTNIKYLINLGARIDVQDKNRMTALLHFYRSRIYYNDTLLIRKYLKLTVKKLAVLQNSLDIME
ncbi:ankyrin repeat-containing domain protein [Neocallimastix lanati (nom. inval.)]|nr:ankyrin repeat-containing domain protein [Neocallimastix sp. JGI-2020a]